MANSLLLPRLRQRVDTRDDLRDELRDSRSLARLLVARKRMERTASKLEKIVIIHPLFVVFFWKETAGPSFLSLPVAFPRFAPTDGQGLFVNERVPSLQCTFLFQLHSSSSSLVSENSSSRAEDHRGFLPFPLALAAAAADDPAPAAFFPLASSSLPSPSPSAALLGAPFLFSALLARRPLLTAEATFSLVLASSSRKAWMSTVAFSFLACSLATSRRCLSAFSSSLRAASSSCHS
mmetsp:Transcript_14517/g.36632  ORF Transcript_14517/g.36632 Transcript_14517/m.36632 type:complete len:236 (-) Transcript_14517:613-1320(-)